MRKVLLLAFILSFSLAKAQVLNYSFENWGIDTTHFNGYLTLPAENFTYSDPDNWKSSNSITAMTALGGFSFVTQSNDSYGGSSAIQLRTDTLKKISGTSLTVPGFALNGNYEINVASLVLGTNITPISVLGAGQAYTQRLSKIKGYYKYSPVFNPHTNSKDTCLIWATLRKGVVPIADAIFKSIDSTGGYQPFEASFNYLSCEMPDTLVILLAASIPNIAGVFGGGQTNLVRGSALLVDSLGYDTLAASYNFPPIARPDLDTTSKNTDKNILVKLNDDDCNNPVLGLTINIISQPPNGSAIVGAGNAFIKYSPSNDFTGLDSFSYTLNDGQITSSPAKVHILILENTGINEANKIPVFIFPVPASSDLNIRFEYSGKAFARIYDLLGNISNYLPLNELNNIVSLADLTAGFYSLQIVDEKNVVLGRGKFMVIR